MGRTRGEPTQRRARSPYHVRLADIVIRETQSPKVPLSARAFLFFVLFAYDVDILCAQTQIQIPFSGSSPRQHAFPLDLANPSSRRGDLHLDFLKRRSMVLCGLRGLENGFKPAVPAQGAIVLQGVLTEDSCFGPCA